MPAAGAHSVRGFASLARAAIEKHVPDSRTPSAHWVARPGVVWVRWPTAGGAFAFLALRRHLGWVTGEAGLTREPVGLDELPFGAAGDPPGAEGRRVRLAVLLGEGDHWWPAGSGEVERSQRLEWIVLQLRVKAPAWFARHPPAPRQPTG